jgi:hypothetical protein
MSESERLETSAMNAGRMLSDGRLAPDDFDAEDLAMAQLLNSAFHIQEEILPPRYTQTLLGNPLHEPADDDFTDRVADNVFRRLALTRQTPNTQPVVRRHIAARQRHQAKPRTATVKKRSVVRQSLLALAALVMLLAFESTFNGAAFANVLQYLVVGHSGVYPVKSYPTSVSKKGITTVLTPDHTVHFIEKWPGRMVDGYTISSVNIVSGVWWSDGAIVNLGYQKTDATGLHQLTILEFIPRAQVVLQVVQDGAASSMPIGAENGIFVTGHWADVNHMMTWVPGERAELISGDSDESHVVFWIAADGLSDLNATQMRAMLVDVTNSMQRVGYDQLLSVPGSIQHGDGDLSVGLGQLFKEDIIALVPDRSNPNAPTLYFKVDTSSNQQGSSPMMGGS